MWYSKDAHNKRKHRSLRCGERFNQHLLNVTGWLLSSQCSHTKDLTGLEHRSYSWTFSIRKRDLENEVNCFTVCVLRTAALLLPGRVHLEQVLIPALFPPRDWLLLQLLPSPGPFLPGAAQYAAASLSVPPAGLWYQKSFLHTGRMFLSTSQSKDIKNCSLSSENQGCLQDSTNIRVRETTVFCNLS